MTSSLAVELTSSGAQAEAVDYASTVSDADREKFTEQLLSQLDTSPETAAVSEYLARSLRPIDLPHLILHARVEETSHVTVLAVLMPQFELGHRWSNEQLDQWYSAILGNLHLHPYEHDINGVMQLITQTIVRLTHVHDHQISEFGKFLLDLAEILLICQENNRHSKNAKVEHRDFKSAHSLFIPPSSSNSADSAAASSTSSSTNSILDQPQPVRRFNIHTALDEVVSLLPSSVPLHPLWLSLIRLLRQHGANSFHPNGDGQTPIHTLIQRSNISALLAWLVDESDDLHSFSLKDAEDLSDDRLPYIESVLESALTVAQENPFSTSPRFCLEVVTKVIEWQNEDRQQHETKEEAEARSASYEDETKMKDAESSPASHFSPPNIQSWLQERLISLPRLLVSSHLSDQFRIEKIARDGEDRFLWRNCLVNVPGTAFIPALPLLPPSPATISFISSLISYPNDIHLDECVKDDQCLLAHIFSTPQAVMHILMVPTAADLFLWRIDAMSREGMIRDKTRGEQVNCRSAIASLFRLVILRESDEKSTCIGETSFIDAIFDAMLAKYVKGIELDKTTGMAKVDSQQVTWWICTLTRNHNWSITTIMRILPLFRKYHIPHSLMRELLLCIDENNLDHVREYVRLTMASDFLQPDALCNGLNIHEYAQSRLEAVKARFEDMHDYVQIALSRCEVVEEACVHVQTILYPQLRHEIEVWMIPDLTSITMEYLVFPMTSPQSTLSAAVAPGGYYSPTSPVYTPPTPFYTPPYSPTSPLQPMNQEATN